MRDLGGSPSRRCLALLAMGLLLAASARADEQAALRAGNEALARDDLEGAITHYSAGSVDAPDSPQLTYNLGVAQLRAGDTQAAGQLFARAAELAQAQGDRALEARARYNLGLSLAGGGRAPLQPPTPPPPPPGTSGGAAGSRSATGHLPEGAAPLAEPPVLGMGQPSPAAGGPPAGSMPAGADFQGALKAFKRAIELDPEDLDSKYNFLQVRRLLEQQQQQQQQQQKNQDGEDQDQDQDQDQQQQQNQDQDQQPDQQPDQDQQQQQNQDQQQDQQQNQDQQQQQQQQQQDPQDAPSSEAIERLLDALESEEKERLREALTSRKAREREVTHDW